MSDYPAAFNSISKFLFTATNLAERKEITAMCAAYYCRSCWVKQAYAIYQKQPNQAVVILIPYDYRTINISLSR